MRGADIITQYLKRYAAPEAALAVAGGRYEHVCVIPALDESATLLTGLEPARCHGRWLCVLVVNATADATPAVRARNAALVRDLAAACRGPVVPLADAPPMWRGDRGGYDLLVVDRSSDSHALPAGQGVGLARRIGADIALAHRAAGIVRSRWIHLTDADVELPGDYFTAAAAAPAKACALLYPFWHRDGDDAAIDAATGLYELYLRYHRLGLAWAGSPYAWHTVGSTLAVDAEAYAAVRGVPRRQAGEDFYLIDKLVKLGPIAEPASGPVLITARRSQRAPFGTGAATATIAAELARGQVYEIYHPRVYALLGAWLRALERFADAPAEAAEAALDAAVHANGTGASRCSPDEHTLLARAVDAIGARAALADTHARARSPAARRRRVEHWFDAFRTLKLIHALRDLGLASRPWPEALTRAPFLTDIDLTGADPATLPSLDPAALSSLVRNLRRGLCTLEQRRPGPGS
ncbi:hypothetical protein [Haliangium sp.]|uniref:hypothetical protein n=1 Tax=Haliangium sp. TaxID=2663208 RepID=UPI003D103E7D